jgi:hypothetical protein
MDAQNPSGTYWARKLPCEMPTDAEQAFLDGFRFGSSWQIAAHDPVLGLCASYSPRLLLAAQLDPLIAAAAREEASIVDEHVIGSMRAVKRTRGAADLALDFYRRERDLTA